MHIKVFCCTISYMSFTSSRDLRNGGGGGRGQSLLNFRQKIQISDNPSPFVLEKAVISPLTTLTVTLREGDGRGLAKA
jgi:hypothetical protein